MGPFYKQRHCWIWNIWASRAAKKYSLFWLENALRPGKAVSSKTALNRRWTELLFKAFCPHILKQAKRPGLMLYIIMELTQNLINGAQGERHYFYLFFLNMLHLCRCLTDSSAINLLIELYPSCCFSSKSDFFWTSWHRSPMRIEISILDEWQWDI